MIEARNLSKRYGPVVAVEDFSFTVESGQVTGFLGPNGSGKSTTMRTIVGSTPAPYIPVGMPAIICYGSPRPIGSLAPGSTRCSPPSD